MAREESLYDRVCGAVLWVAAFCFACGFFFSLTLTFDILPPTPFVGVGAITIQRYAKVRDYLGAALFFLLVPPLTVWFRGIGRGLTTVEQKRLPPAMSYLRPAVALLFALPFFLSPLFYLTTGKFGWVLVLPVALAYTATRTFTTAVSSLWLRSMASRDLYPYHALLFAEGLSWILYRYLVTGRRIAHYPTLLLELVFVGLFLALFWGVAFLIVRMSELMAGVQREVMFARITTAALPLILLPIVALVWVPATGAAWVLVSAFLIVALLALRVRPLAPRAAWKLAALVLMPLIVYVVSYGSSAHGSQWIDMFHRGETLGPASDYLRGKAPYREVFALHGMLEDGQLDAWLMELFGRSAEVSIARSAILGGMLAVSLWYLGLAIFESVPLALVVVVMGAWTTAENDRTFFQIAAVALFWYAVKRKKRIAAVAAGVFAAAALFFSYDIGLYTIVGGLAASGVLWIVARRQSWEGLSPVAAALSFIAGVVLGALPFMLYLTSRSALGEFFSVSFVVIPRIIDAVWSLPFPDLVSMFRNDLNLRTLADFVVWERFHLILSPLTIAIAAVYYIHQLLRRRADLLDHTLMVLTVFAAITQRSAFGRAEFRHQYFAAFLIGPIIVLLILAAIRQLRRIWTNGGEGHRTFVVAVAVAAVPLFAVLFWIPDLIDWRIQTLIDYQRRVQRAQFDPQADEVRQRIDVVREEIAALTRPNEPIFDFSDQPALYFFTNRPNPTRFYQIPIASPREFQAEIITALEKAKPKVIIRTSPETFDEFDGISNNLRAQALAAYIDDTYVFYKSARGVDLWTRKPRASAAPLRSYLAKIRLPDLKEAYTTARARMVFPLVGSTPGVNGSYWQSDLTLHNPYREKIYVALRYIGGERADRRLWLAPRQTVRWPDVVRTFFATKGGIGTMWIDYREQQAPIAVLKTSDVAHGGRASLESPLTKKDTAFANTESAELTIVGIPPEVPAGRRINLGVVNSGIVPANFRITARGRNGRVIGKPLEAWLAESELWLVENAERALGVPLNEDVTVRVTALTGSGVAFATVIDLNGDTDFIPAIPSQQQQ